MKKKEALIILGASESSLLLIKKAKEEYSLIVIDKNPKAPGFDFCDEKIIISTYDAVPIVNRLSKIRGKYEFKGIITRSSGMPVVTMAKIAERFNLPGVKPAVAEKIVFKDKLMEKCQKWDIAAPRCLTASKLDDIDWDKIIFPAILKPTLGIIGKKGVKKVRNKKELIAQFQNTKKTSYNGRVNIETCEKGDDIILMAFSIKGKLHPIVLLDEMNRFDKEGFVKPIGLRCPSKHSGEKMRVYKFAQSVIDKFGIDTSVFLMSCKFFSDKSLKLVEIHLDLGGDNILDELLPKSSDIDFVKLALKVVTGQEMQRRIFKFSLASIFVSEKEKL